jgi:MFS family permease
LFIAVEMQARAPLIRLSLFADPRLSSSLALTLLVTTVMMTTLVVGPFYLSRGLGLSSAMVGLALSVGPLLAACGGVPAGRLVDRFGARRVVPGALLGLAGGCALLALLPTRLGLPGYLLPMTLVASSYALFQAANNTGLMAGQSGSARRGVGPARAVAQSRTDHRRGGHGRGVCLRYWQPDASPGRRHRQRLAQYVRGCGGVDGHGPDRQLAWVLRCSPPVAAGS